MADFAGMSTLDVWYARRSEEELMAMASAAVGATKAHTKADKKAEKKALKTAAKDRRKSPHAR